MLRLVRLRVSLPLALALIAGCASTPQTVANLPAPAQVGPVPLSAAARIIENQEVRDERPGRGVAIEKKLPFALAVTKPTKITAQGIRTAGLVCDWDLSLRQCDSRARHPGQHRHC